VSREYFWALLTLIGAVLLAIVSVNVVPRSETARYLPACPESVEDSQKIRRLMKRGFDSAFVAQIGLLFKVYGQNIPNVEKQRELTKKGMENAIVAYRIGMEAVDNWECG